MSSRVVTRNPRYHDAPSARGGDRGVAEATYQNYESAEPDADLVARRATRRERMRTARERQVFERERSERARPQTASIQSMPAPATEPRPEPRGAHTLRIVSGGATLTDERLTDDNRDDAVSDTSAPSRPCKCPPCHRGLYTLTLLLTLLSVPLVYSASTAIALDHYSNPDFFLTRQIGFVFMGLLMLTGVSRLPARHLRGLVWVLFGVTLLGLLATKFTPLGLTLGGVRRWVRLGPIPLQFSELAKIAVVGVLADFWSRAARTAQKSSLPWLMAFGLTLPIGVLVFAQPHLSAAALLFMLPFCIAFFAAVPARQMLGVALVCVLLAGGGTGFMKPYQRARLVAQFSSHGKDAQGSNYQALQGMRALQRGGLLGTGPGGGLFKQGHLPAPHTDFILAVTGEEWGLVGMLGLLTVYGAIIFFCFHTAHCASQPFEALLCAGVGTLLAIQLLCNASVVTGLLPVTGMPLPLLSYGGSGLLCTLLGIGLVLSVSRQTGELAESSEIVEATEGNTETAQGSYKPRARLGRDLGQQPYLL